MSYFVILNHQNPDIALPMTDPDDEWALALFDTIEAARKAANDNLLGAHFGYEIFDRGSGEH